MNLVSLLIATAIVKLGFGAHASTAWRVVIAVLCLAVVVGAVWMSKRRGIAVGAEPDTSPASAGETATSAASAGAEGETIPHQGQEPEQADPGVTSTAR